jgi:hypothetical protein
MITDISVITKRCDENPPTNAFLIKNHKNTTLVSFLLVYNAAPHNVSGVVWIKCELLKDWK